jgi:tRNA 2-thiouridine synthesizing protein A
MAVIKLDLTGLKCPLPALMTRKAMKNAAIGDCLEVQCTDPLAAIDIPALVQQSGDAMDAMRHIDGVFTFIIRKTNDAIAHQN